MGLEDRLDDAAQHDRIEDQEDGRGGKIEYGELHEASGGYWRVYARGRDVDRSGMQAPVSGAFAPHPRAKGARAD
ncbi:hypothetical protein GCM10011534_04170 [Pseudooceanicola nanhaiensis]|uniref:Uncharacterized protein n=1 Tax=Pseudooceanicola nanhaiensis TaxID=375761 RepID=A0A917WAU8_9RHOB|nr:hypothetical protein GCM10011534_04170 [Pseudooceanicola nanhaiensis]